MKFYIEYYPVEPHQWFHAVTDDYKDDPTYINFQNAKSHNIRDKRNPNIIHWNNCNYCEIEADSVKIAIDIFLDEMRSCKEDFDPLTDGFVLDFLKCTRKDCPDKLIKVCPNWKACKYRTEPTIAELILIYYVIEKTIEKTKEESNDTQREI